MIEINLLPKEYRKRSRAFRLDKKMMYVAAGVGAVILLLATVTFYQQYQISSLDDDILKASQRRARLQEDIKLIDNLSGLKQRIIQRMEAIEKLDRFRAVWVDLLEDVNQRVPEFLWLTRIAEPRQKGGQANAKKQVPGEMPADSIRVEEFIFDKDVYTEIEGYAFTLSSVASFLIGLNKSDYFENIDLKFAKEQEVRGVSAYNFKISCKMSFDHVINGSDIEGASVPTIAER